MDPFTTAPTLTAALAQEIAGDTSDIIGLNVLITDRDGTVIGSGDRARVGTFHEASVEVMRTSRPATHTAAQARRLRGVRPGITLPIVLSDKAIGTVGITGSPSRVRRFGLVVKRQTEILLEESVLLRSRLLRERAIEDLVRDIAYFDAEVVEADLVTYRAAELGYDLLQPRIAVLIDVGGTPDCPIDQRRPTQRLALLRTIRVSFADSHDIVAAMPSDRFVVLHRAAARPVRDGEIPDLRASCHRVVDEVSRRHGLVARIGIGSTATSVAALHDSYQDASTALRLSSRLVGQSPVNAIDDLWTYQLLIAVAHRARTRFVDALLAALHDQPDWPVLRQTIIAWCETGFSLVRAAAVLHIHRNTLVYRLDKIAQLQGASMHDHRATLDLYLACLASQLDDASQ
jgi:carbohydrate diacid regulator